MKKRLLSLSLVAALMLGSVMTVSAEEAPADGQPQAGVQNYQKIMTPEILESFQSATVEDDDLSVLADAIIRRTDIWDSLLDEDGDGIDDRDPINGCGYLDLNYNGFDDRYEMALIQSAAEEDPMAGLVLTEMFSIFSHMCAHGIIASDFMYDDEVGYLSIPNYFLKCDECGTKLIERMDAVVDMLDNLSILEK